MAGSENDITPIKNLLPSMEPKSVKITVKEYIGISVLQQSKKPAYFSSLPIRKIVQLLLLMR